MFRFSVAWASIRNFENRRIDLVTFFNIVKLTLAAI